MLIAQLDTKVWTYEYAQCRRQTSVTAGTVMHGSKLSLTVWFWGAYLMATHSNGMSARQLWRQLGLGSYKSAWLLCAKLRRAMVAPDCPHKSLRRLGRRPRRCHGRLTAASTSPPNFPPTTIKLRVPPGKQPFPQSLPSRPR